MNSSQYIKFWNRIIREATIICRHEQPQIDDQCDMSDHKFQRPHRLSDHCPYIVLVINCKVSLRISPYCTLQCQIVEIHTWTLWFRISIKYFMWNMQVRASNNWMNVLSFRSDHNSSLSNHFTNKVQSYLEHIGSLTSQKGDFWVGEQQCVLLFAFSRGWAILFPKCKTCEQTRYKSEYFLGDTDV